MLEVERELKAAHMLGQNRAKAVQFMSRHAAYLSEDVVAVDNFQRRPQVAPRFLGIMQTQNMSFPNPHDHQFQEYSS
jgi:hypothetical protein